MQTKILTDDRILKITGRIKIVFIFFICILILGVIHDLLKFSGGMHQSQSLEGIVSLSAFSLLYIGLKLRKRWFIPFVLIVSALACLNLGFQIFQPVVDVHGLFVKIGGMVFFIFFVYQMWFFSRREVKAYFGAKENFLF